MAPYKVALIHCDGSRLDLVVPLPNTLTLDHLTTSALTRAAKHAFSFSDSRNTILRLGSDTGFLVDPEDVIDEVLTTSDTLFIVEKPAPQTGTGIAAQSLACPSGIRVRIITPLGARRHEDARHLPLLKQGQVLPLSTTLGQLRTNVADHLGLSSYRSQTTQHQECNCVLAELLVKRGRWDKVACSGHLLSQCRFVSRNEQPIKGECAKCSNALSYHSSVDEGNGSCTSFVLVRKDLGCGHVVNSSCIDGPGASWVCSASCMSKALEEGGFKILVVSDTSKCELINVETANREGIMASLKKVFGEDVEENKTIHMKGGRLNNDHSGTYEKLPVVSICANERHGTHALEKPEAANSASLSTLNILQLDLHTIEGPIETSRDAITFAEARLSDLAVTGIVSIFAVEWRSDGKQKTASWGKDAMFAAAPHWILPVPQSDRGMAAALSCLRVLAHIVADKTFEDFHHNEILRLFHLLTRFPPAVRAFHILISGKSLRPSECAALIQSLSATLQDLVPKAIIDHDTRRVLEASRLLLGLILNRMRRAKQPDSKSVVNSDNPNLPWISALKTIDLKDCKSMEPVTNPVLTNLGIMERNAYEALNDEGILGFSPHSKAGTLAMDPDYRGLRVALLYGGKSNEVSYYDADALMAAYLLSEKGDTLGTELKNFSKDLQYLAVLCEETKLSVVAPRQLSSAQVPCLTLDREGYLAVYTGQAACAPPDRDKAIYRPLSGAEENIDVGIVAQMLEPILQTREREGTAIFDLFSSTFRRKDTTPSELLVVAIDISQSMDKSSDFPDDGPEDDEFIIGAFAAANDVVLDEPNDAGIEFSETRDWLMNHESIQDILAILNSSPNAQLRNTAEEIVDFLRTLLSRQIAHLAVTEQKKRSWVTSAFLSSRGRQVQRQMDGLRRTLTGLHRYERALCDQMIFRAQDTGFQSSPFIWNYGQDVPVVDAPAEALEMVDVSESCVVPSDFIDPIGQGVIEDPVTTSDNVGPYERRNIERWFRSNSTSPLTGLPLTDKTLRHNQVLANSIMAWVSGQDIIAAAPSTPKRIRSSARARITLNFVSPSGTFTRVLPGSLPLADLHKICFRGMRGVYSKFSLHVNGTVLPCSTETLNQRSLRSGQEILVHAASNPGDENAPQPESEGEMCLIKVYNNSRADSEEQFAYWTPRNTPASLASVLFRFWRFHQNSWFNRSHDLEVWTGLHYGGDGTLVGHRSNSWDNISTHLDRLGRTEILRDEKLCKRPKAASSSDALDSDDDDQIVVDKDSSEDEFGEVRTYGRYRVLKLDLNRYRSPEEDEKDKQMKLRTLTRLGVTKQVFTAFINRLIAYNFPVTVGLVLFGTEAKVTQPLTDVIENFRTAIERMEAKGDTALWNGIALAADRIIEYEKKFSGVKKRILVLSDGKDTSSTKSAADVSRLLVQNQIVVDSISIGHEENDELRTVSYLTGGYKFVPKTLEDAVGICELEPVLSQDERPSIERPLAPAFLTHVGFSMAAPQATADVATRDIYPQHKVHPNLKDTFVRIDQFAKSARELEEPAADGHTPSTLRSRRILTEIRDLATRPHPQYDVYVSESNMAFWKIVLQGPSESAYSSGAFAMYLHMDESYPRSAPKGRFVTKIFHPNVNKQGRICHSIFDRNWTVDTTNKQILDTVFGLMLVPEFSDPVNTVVTLNFYWDEVAFKAEAEKHIEKYAKQNRQELGMEILGET